MGRKMRAEEKERVRKKRQEKFFKVLKKTTFPHQNISSWYTKSIFLALKTKRQGCFLNTYVKLCKNIKKKSKR